MKLNLEIETHDRRIGFDIAAIGNTLTAGTIIEAPGGAKVEYKGTIVRRSVGIPEVLQFVIDASVNLELTLLGTWLYEKVQHRKVERMLVNRREVVEISPTGITRVLEEEIRLKREIP
jgi:hypothetical protein